ncbi:hypothetical protein ACIBKX_40310 [Streptomyces sp. NPDC050658]|uniref:hypothetical protein n=1 Tax=unclassified Streptomyces TaxID=2593676 RepID=UPI003427B3C8
MLNTAQPLFDQARGGHEPVSMAEDDGPVIPTPDIQTFGAVFRMSVQTDSRGAVLLAYTRDAETGAVTRSLIRFDWAGVDYLKRRLGVLNGETS